MDSTKIEEHIRKYRDAYIILGAGIAIGVTLGGIFRGKPKINEALIVGKWMDETAKQGINVYGLTNEQKALWESVWRYAEAQQQRLGWPLAEVVSQMLRDYSDVLGYGPSLDAIT